MEYLYDIYVKYHDEKEERAVGRLLYSGQMFTLLNHLLNERKRHFENKIPETHYPDYVRVE